MKKIKSRMHALVEIEFECFKGSKAEVGTKVPVGGDARKANKKAFTASLAKSSLSVAEQEGIRRFVESVSADPEGGIREARLASNALNSRVSVYFNDYSQNPQAWDKYFENLWQDNRETHSTSDDQIDSFEKFRQDSINQIKRLSEQYSKEK